MHVLKDFSIRHRSQSWVFQTAAHSGMWRTTILARNVCVCVSLYVYVRVRKYMYKHKIYIYIYIYIYTYIYSYAHTTTTLKHTRTHILSLSLSHRIVKTQPNTHTMRVCEHIYLRRMCVCVFRCVRKEDKFDREIDVLGQSGCGLVLVKDPSGCLYVSKCMCI